MPQLRTRYHKIMRNYESILRVFLDKKENTFILLLLLFPSHSSFFPRFFFFTNIFAFVLYFLRKNKKKKSLFLSHSHFLMFSLFWNIQIYFEVYLKFFYKRDLLLYVLIIKSFSYFFCLLLNNIASIGGVYYKVKDVNDTHI